MLIIQLLFFQKMFTEKLFIVYFLFLIPVNAVKAGSVSHYVSQLIQMPIIDKSESENVFVCPSDLYHEKKIFSSFFTQLGTFIPATSLIFAITIYGATSAFVYITTCHIDDIVIFTFTLLPIFAWYTFAKPVWLY